MNSRSRWMSLTIAVLSVAGLVISAVSLHHHYGTSQSSFCDLGGNLNCDIVNRSTYSTLLGIPVALIGIVGYVLLGSLAIFFHSRSSVRTLLFPLSLAGLAFSLYLTYIEGFVLATWCILCLSSLAVIFLITILAGSLALLDRQKS